MTLEESKETYKNYIDTHISNVNKAFNFYGEELCKRLNIDIERLRQVVEVHDKSKYSDKEFEGYRMKFYPDDSLINQEPEYPSYDIEEKFQKAWEHHYCVNPHHPEFWVTRNPVREIVVNEMSKIYIAEMLLDWAAMGFTHNDTAYNYWNSETGGQAKILHQNTIEIINSVIDIFKEKING